MNQDISYVLSKEARQQGFSLLEPGDHILELLHAGKVIAKFSQTGVEVNNILKVTQQPDKPELWLPQGD